jgi:hypothetical protein
MSRTLVSKLDARILEAVVAPATPTMSVPVAKAVASLAFSDAQAAEIHRLLDKLNADTITARERDKLEGDQRVGNFLNLSRAKARASWSHETPRRRTRDERGVKAGNR